MRRQDWLLVLITVTTLAAIVMAYLAVKHGRIELAGASAFTTAISGAEVYVMRWLQGPREEKATAGEAPIEPPPFKWSVLDLQGEVEDDESAGS